MLITHAALNQLKIISESKELFKVAANRKYNTQVLAKK
jgi:hypothetical protein